MENIDYKAIFGVLGLPGLIITCIVTTYVIARSKSYQAIKEAAETWRTNAEAKEAEVKIEREKNDKLQAAIDVANSKISELEKKVTILESRPDLTLIAAAIAKSKEIDDERTSSALVKVLEQFDESRREATEHHNAQLEILTQLLEKIK